MIDMAKYKLTYKIILFFVVILAIYSLRLKFSNTEEFIDFSALWRAPLGAITSTFTWILILLGALLRIVITVGIIAIIIYAVTSHSQSSIP